MVVLPERKGGVVNIVLFYTVLFVWSVTGSELGDISPIKYVYYYRAVAISLLPGEYTIFTNTLCLLCPHNLNIVYVFHRVTNEKVEVPTLYSYATRFGFYLPVCELFSNSSSFLNRRVTNCNECNKHYLNYNLTHGYIT